MSKLYVCEEYENMFTSGFRAIEPLDKYKIKVCKQFAERIKEIFDFCEKNAMGIIDVDTAKGLVDKALAEMEEE